MRNEIESHIIYTELIDNLIHYIHVLLKGHSFVTET